MLRHSDIALNCRLEQGLTRELRVVLPDRRSAPFFLFDLVHW